MVNRLLATCLFTFLYGVMWVTVETNPIITLIALVVTVITAATLISKTIREVPNNDQLFLSLPSLISEAHERYQLYERYPINKK